MNPAPTPTPPIPPHTPESLEPRELNHRLSNIVATMEASLLVLCEAAGDEELSRSAHSALAHQVSHLRKLAADVRQTLCTVCGE